VDRALRVGLTGGIGAGKSTVAALLEAHGAVVTSADEISRDVVSPGSDGLAAVVAEFGDDVLTPAGTLDRRALGNLVFADDLSRARLEEILLPLIAAEAWARMEAVPAPKAARERRPLPRPDTRIVPRWGRGRQIGGGRRGSPGAPSHCLRWRSFHWRIESG